MAGIDWTKYATGGAQRPDSLSGMQPAFNQSLSAMFANAPPEIQSELRVMSGYRSPERQAQLWQEALAKYGSPEAARKWVAPPGKSQHNSGNAADLSYLSPAARAWAHQNAAQYGLAFPLSNEPWHVELATARGGAGLSPVAGGDGNVSLAGGSGADDLTDIDAFLGITPPTAAPAQSAPALPTATVASDYAASGALDVSDIDAFLGVTPITGPPEPAQEPSFLGDVWRGLGLGTRSVSEGLASAVGLAYDPIAAGMNYAMGTEIPPLQDQVSSILTEFGVPEPQGAAERIMAAIQRGAAGSIGGVGAGKAIGGAVGGMMASGPVAQVLGGAGAGLGAQTAAEMGAGPVGQASAGLAGAVIGAAPASIRRPQIGATTADDVARAERAGITPMTSDVFPPQTFAGRSAQRIGEIVPIAGTGPVRAAQQAARVAAVRDLARTFGADAQASDDVMKAFLAKRGADLSKYSALKNDVITNIPGKVSVENTVAAIDDQVAKLRSLKTAEMQPVIAKLEDWKRAVQDQDLVNIELLRKQMGEAFEAPELASVRSTGKKALSSIYGAIKQDMGDHIKANGQPRDFTKWSVANARLSEMMGDLDKTSLKSALANGDQTPEAIRGLLFSSKPSDVKALYKALPPEGRARARGAVLQEAITKASDGEMLSPQKFRSQLIKMGGQIGVFFGGDDLKAVDGLLRVLDMTKRAGDAAASGPTGVQNLPVLGGMALTDMAGGLGAGMASGGAIGLTARALESKPVRDMMIKLATTAPGSKEEAAMIKRIMEAARAQPDEATND